MKTTLIFAMLLSITSQVHSDIITFSGDDWVSGAEGAAGVNHGRTFIGAGAGDSGWTLFDDGTTVNSSRQQWLWMDTSSALTLIPAGHTITSATLSFPGAKDIDNDGASVIYSLFEVSGSDRGRAAVIAAGTAGRDGNDVPDFFASNTAYGSVTGLTNAFAPQTFDLTPLVAGWHSGTLTTNPGQLNLLWDSRGGARNYARWVNEESDNQPGLAVNRPTLTIQTTIPEPSALSLLLLGGIAVMHRMRLKKAC